MVHIHHRSQASNMHEFQHDFRCKKTLTAYHHTPSAYAFKAALVKRLEAAIATEPPQPPNPKPTPKKPKPEPANQYQQQPYVPPYTPPKVLGILFIRILLWGVPLNIRNMPHAPPEQARTHGHAPLPLYSPAILQVPSYQQPPSKWSNRSGALKMCM